MASNPYKVYLQKYFARLLDLRHNTSKITTLLKESVAPLVKIKKVKILHASSLVIRDWTGEKGEKDPLIHTGISSLTLKSKYKKEVGRLISVECCYSIAQAFEAIESFLKNCIHYKCKHDQEYLRKVKSKMQRPILRNTLPGGESLFQLLKLACGHEMNFASRNNIYSVRFKEFWTVLSDTRHSITHSSNRIKKDKLKWSAHHFDLFRALFDFKESVNYIDIELDYSKTEDLIKRFAEFGFQLYKCISIAEGKEWHIRRT